MKRTTKRTTTKGTTKATKTARAKLLAAYAKAKLAVQGKCKIGTTVTYSGRNNRIDGERVKIVGHEAGRGGVFVEFKGKRHVVSPHALLAGGNGTHTTEARS